MFAGCEAGTRRSHYSGYSLIVIACEHSNERPYCQGVECGWNVFCPTLPNISFSIKYLRLGWNGWNRNHTVFCFTDIFSERWANKPTERLSLLIYIASGLHLIYHQDYTLYIMYSSPTNIHLQCQGQWCKQGLRYNI